MFIGYSGSRPTRAGLSSIPCYVHACLIKICSLCTVMSAPCNYSDPCLQNYINTANFPNSPESENGKMTLMSTLRVRLYQSESESESDIASDLLHCFQSVCLYYSVV